VGAVAAAAPAAALVAAIRAAGQLGVQAINARQIPAVITTRRAASTDCVLPDGTNVAFFHCYTPRQIRAAYGVNSVAPISVGGDGKE
jgi:hypothetical protein